MTLVSRLSKCRLSKGVGVHYLEGCRAAHTMALLHGPLRPTRYDGTNTRRPTVALSGGPLLPPIARANGRLACEGQLEEDAT